MATTTRSGKAIRRAKAGGKGVLASKGVHLHAKAWAKARKLDLSLTSWLVGVIGRAAK